MPSLVYTVMGSELVIIASYETLRVQFAVLWKHLLNPDNMTIKRIIRQRLVSKQKNITMPLYKSMLHEQLDCLLFVPPSVKKIA